MWMEFVSRRLGSQEVLSVRYWTKTRKRLRLLLVSRLLSILCEAAELFPHLLANVENLIVKDDLEQLLRHLIIY